MACIDRSTGLPRPDRAYSPRLLDWGYNSPVGRWAMDTVLARRVVAAAYGFYGRLPCSRTRLARFCEAVGIDMSESVRPLGSFASLNDLFTREIDLSRRPVDTREDVCIAPVDGRYLVYPTIRMGEPFRVKALAFDLRSFLRDESLVARYDGGALVVARLGLADYHHFHFPVGGLAGAPRRIAGMYHAVGPYSRIRDVPALAENVRVVTLVETRLFGCIAMVEVGAFSIGSIRETFTSGTTVAKGDRKGFFAIGGSLVALLFPPGQVRLAPDLVENSSLGIETYVRLGEPLGVSPAGRHDDRPGGSQ